MNKTEITVLALLGVALATVVIFSTDAGKAAASAILPADTGDILAQPVGISQSPDDANSQGPAYLVSNMPYGFAYGMMQAPMVTQGFAGQASDTNDYDAMSTNNAAGCRA